jgi:hypothetical protein
MRWLFVALALVGCDDDATSPRDLAAAVADLAAPPGSDLSARSDASCTLQHFMGFPGMSDVERRLDCSCGCIIDPLDDTIVNGMWGLPKSSGGSYAPGPDGLAVTVARNGTTEFAALVSTSPVNPFFLDGDFDVSVDYELRGAIPPDAHAQLSAATPANNNTVERARLTDGSQTAQAIFPGVPPAAHADSSTSGTLELFKKSGTIEAIADGSLVSQRVGVTDTRFSLQLFVTLGACDPDGGDQCSFTVAWKNLRMTGGSLVDRR